MHITIFHFCTVNCSSKFDHLKREVTVLTCNSSDCPKTLSGVKGSGVYSFTSKICLSAMHDGKLKAGENLIMFLHVIS